MLRIGLVGLGWIARHGYLPSLLGQSDVEITAVCARSEQRVGQLADRYRFKAVFNDYQQMAQEAQIDCAMVLTDPESHADISRAFLSHGIHVLCEKPMSLDVFEAEELVALAAEKNCVYQVGFGRRFAPVYLQAKAALADKPLHLCLSLQNCAADRIAFPPSLARRTLLKTPQAVDTLRFFCGEAVEVMSTARFDDPAMEQTVTALIRFDSGAVGVLINDYTGGVSDERIELAGAGVTIHASIHEQRTRIWECASTQPDAVHPSMPKHAREISTAVSSDYATNYGIAQLIQHFIECVRDPRPTALDGAEALKTQRLVSEIYRCAGLPPLT